jgi:hypothetical protein
MSTRDVPYEAASAAERRTRGLLAALLRAASRGLDRLALSLSLADPAPDPERVLEFHADAGAPEGALYVNGELVGYVTGVTRL